MLFFFFSTVSLEGVMVVADWTLKRVCLSSSLMSMYPESGATGVLLPVRSSVRVALIRGNYLLAEVSLYP